MDRRKFTQIAAMTTLAVPLRAYAQPQGRVPRIAFLYFGTRQSAIDTGRYDAFLQGLRDLGYVDGKTAVLDARFADGRNENLPALVADIARGQPDVIVATGSPVYRALRDANIAIPVVVTVTADPVGEGLAARIARPGGNFTGLADAAADLGPKQMELLMSVVPRMTRVGALLNPDNGTHSDRLKRLMIAAQQVGVLVVLAEATSAAELGPALSSLGRARVNAVIMFGDAFFTQAFAQIAQATLERRLPSIALIRDYPKAGGLMSYGADPSDSFRRAGPFVDKIVKGAKPADLPFEHPVRYMLAVNTRTAKALNLSIPQQVLLRADEVFS